MTKKIADKTPRVPLAHLTADLACFLVHERLDITP